jgi:hypothetical protein
MCVQLWHSRKEKTIESRGVTRNYTTMHGNQMKRKCFKFLKQEFRLRTFIFRKILNASLVLNKENQRFALNQMKQLKLQRQISKENNQRNCRDMIATILRKYQDQATKKYFDNMKFKTIVNL